MSKKKDVPTAVLFNKLQMKTNNKLRIADLDSSPYISGLIRFRIQIWIASTNSNKQE